MEVEGSHGENLAMVKKALVTPIRDRWMVEPSNNHPGLSSG
jgi:hypothetical protein